MKTILMMILGIILTSHVFSQKGKKEIDPIFSISVAKSITAADTTSWNSKLDVEVDGDINNEIQV